VCLFNTWLRVAVECAKGLQFMHKIGYMHRDVKSLNVFLDGDMVAKVADFGMATNMEKASDCAGTIQWMAPEVLHNVLGRRSVYDKRSDVYSYGVMVWEIFHCEIPYANTGLDQMGIANGVLRKQHTLSPKPGFCPPEVAKVIKDCLSFDVRGRPTFDQVVPYLAKVSEKV